MDFFDFHFSFFTALHYYCSNIHLLLYNLWRTVSCRHYNKLVGITTVDLEKSQHDSGETDPSTDL